MACRRLGAEHGDNANDGEAGERLDDGVAAQLQNGVLRRADIGVLHQARREALPVDGGDGDHNEEQSDLRQKELAIGRAGQSLDAAGEIPGVDVPLTSSVPTVAMPSVEKRRSPCAQRRARLHLCRRAEEQRQRRQRAEPGRRGDQMQNSAAGWTRASASWAADGVAGPGQRAGESRGRNDRAIVPIEARLCRSDRKGTKLAARTSAKRAAPSRPSRNGSATAPSIRRLRTEHPPAASPLIDAAVRISHTAPEPSARTRLNQKMKASLGHSAARRRVASGAPGKSRSTDEDDEKDHARRHQRGGEMDGPHVNHGIGQAGPPVAAIIALSFAADMEREAVLVSYGCRPRARASAPGRFPAPPALIPIRIVLPLTCALPWPMSAPLGIGHGDGREGRLEVLRECQRHFVRRARTVRADQRACMVEKGVGPRGRRTERHVSNSARIKKRSHGVSPLEAELTGAAVLPPSSGRPIVVGNMSSR